MRKNKDLSVAPQEEQRLTIGQRMGITKKVIHAKEELDLKERPDRIGRYLKKYLNNFVFAEFSEEFLRTSKASDIMRGVPVPLRKEDIRTFGGGEGVDIRILSENMTWVIGCDPHFKYTQNYCDFLLRMYNDKVIETILKQGRDAAEREEYDNACVHFRTCLCLKPDYLHAMYSYARVCRAMYQNSNNKEYVGRFKAEALDFFELTSDTHPRHALSHYYLGYAYLNMGYYIKAELAWKDFMRYSRNGKDKKEIRERLQQIHDPVTIEQGYTHIMAGRMEEGKRILEPYLDSRFNTWWPLHYYLGVAYKDTGDLEKAEERLLYALKKNPSHLESMEELADVFRMTDQPDRAQKYSKKAAVIRKQLEEEEEERRAYEAKHNKEKDSMDYVRMADSKIEKAHSKEEQKEQRKEKKVIDAQIQEAKERREAERKKLLSKKKSGASSKDAAGEDNAEQIAEQSDAVMKPQQAAGSAEADKPAEKPADQEKKSKRPKKLK